MNMKAEVNLCAWCVVQTLHTGPLVFAKSLTQTDQPEKDLVVVRARCSSSVWVDEIHHEKEMPGHSSKAGTSLVEPPPFSKKNPENQDTELDGVDLGVAKHEQEQDAQSVDPTNPTAVAGAAVDPFLCLAELLENLGFGALVALSALWKEQGHDETV